MQNKLQLLSCAACLFPLAGAQAQQRPNIIVILTDDMGYSDLGCYGGTIDTPNLDALAANGLHYMQFYNTARSCPSRASLLTGLHPHQTGVGHMVDRDDKEDGYRGDLNRSCVTLGEVMRATGYETYAVGKWHVAMHRGPQGPKHNWPLQRGFDHFYGTIMGGGSFYDPASLCRGNDFITPENDPLYRPEEFYYTNAITDNALAFLTQREDRTDRPFFMYMAYTAAHWPMQVPEEDIEPFRGRFDEGWDEIRRQKYADMVARGIIDPAWVLSEDETVRPWDKVENREFELRCMEVYAGMVANMDRNVGRMVSYLRETGQLDNTVIIYLHDNGGCAEPMERGREAFTVHVPDNGNLDPMAPDELQTRLIPYKTRDGRPMRRGQVMPGGADTYVAYGKGWAYASNTPFREYKHWVHEGGIATPLIVHWPAGITAAGQMRWRPGQLTDIMATCVELSGAEYPEHYDGNAIIPYEGKSLVPTFETDDPSDERYLYWEHEGNRAVRSGKWKLVYKARDGYNKDIPPDMWELYDMEADRTETRDLAQAYPEKVRELAARWEEFAVRCKVKPWKQ
ncbi:MAG: arylsulfatase [Alistipes sp.]|nr:arylsulfatase [Alistipes sp.]